MNDSFSASYAAAGVDVTAGYESVELIKSHVKRTEIPGVIGSIGGFGGMFELLIRLRISNFTIFFILLFFL